MSFLSFFGAPPAYSEADADGWFVTWLWLKRPMSDGGKDSGTVMAKKAGNKWVFRRLRPEEQWATQLTQVM